MDVTLDLWSISVFVKLPLFFLQVIRISKYSSNQNWKTNVLVFRSVSGLDWTLNSLTLTLTHAATNHRRVQQIHAIFLWLYWSNVSVNSHESLFWNPLQPWPGFWFWPDQMMMQIFSFKWFGESYFLYPKWMDTAFILNYATWTRCEMESLKIWL